MRRDAGARGSADFSRHRRRRLDRRLQRRDHRRQSAQRHRGARSVLERSHGDDARSLHPRPHPRRGVVADHDARRAQFLQAALARRRHAVRQSADELDQPLRHRADACADREICRFPEAQDEPGAAPRQRGQCRDRRARDLRQLLRRSDARPHSGERQPAARLSVDRGRRQVLLGRRHHQQFAARSGA